MGDDGEFKNYFNYFTEAEEHFRNARRTFFLFSTLDWALVESWKNAGVPLEAVLRGIDAAFEKWRSKKNRTQMVNSIAYCAQAIAHEAEIIAGTVRPKSTNTDAPPFSLDEVRHHLLKNSSNLRAAGLDEIAGRLEALAGESETQYGNLEALEQTLTALEDKLIAILRSRLTEDDLIAARRELDLQLRPYRGKMTAEQLSMLEKQYLDRRLFEHAHVPRLSLFYLR